MSADEIDIDGIDLALLALLRKKPRGASAGVVTLKIGIPIGRIAKSFRKLRRLRFVRENGAVLFLTKRGRRWILENQSMFAFSGEKDWRKVPEHFKQPQLRPFKPYAPISTKVSRQIFRVEG